MEDKNKGDKEVVVPPATDTKKEDSSPQSEVKKELAKIKPVRSKKEQLLYTKERVEKQLAELGDGDENIDSALSEDEGDDSKPLTIGDYKKLQKKDAQKTALQKADAIEDEDDRTLVKHYLQTRIVPSGDPDEDLKFAIAAVNSVKNAQVAQIASQKRVTKRQSSGGGAPAKVEDRFEPTDEELQMAKFAKAKDVKEFILKARKNAEDAEV